MNKLKSRKVAGLVAVMVLCAGLGVAGLSSAQIIHEETRFGTAGPSPTVTTSASLIGANGNLYLAAITTKPKLGVTSVSGLGLNWKPVKAQCSGRNSTNVQVWMAQGTPTGNEAVTATFADSVKNAILIVSRYSGVHATFPLGNVISGNTTGSNGACVGGVDILSYLFNLTTGSNGTLVYGAVVMRSKTNQPGPGFIERAELIKGTGGDVVSMAVQDKSIPTATSATIDGFFNSPVDWALVALEIRPANATGGPIQYSLTTNADGLGSVEVSPEGGTYDSGAEVTLKALPVAGFKFDAWSGDLTSLANPVKLTMNAHKHVIARFSQVIPQYRLNVNTLGNGSVTLNPPGGTYRAGTVVTLTAKPAPSFVFGGWKGALTGLTSPRTLVMNAHLNVTATFTGGAATGKVLHKETKFGVASKSLVVTTSENLAPANGQLYLAAISSKPKLGVVRVEGLGLNWTPVKLQCSGRNGNVVQVWMAQGTPTGATPVTATFADTAVNAIILVSRYFGVHATKPLGNVISANTTGLNGDCSGGVDSNTYLMNMSTTAAGSAVFSATTMRSRLHSPGAGYAERAEVTFGIGGDVISVAVADKNFPAAGNAAVAGSFDGVTDWAAVGIELRPLGAPIVNTRFTLVANAVDSGTVNVNPKPPVDGYIAGSTVTLTATPMKGFKFSGWSGDIHNSASPVTIVMNANKVVNANFAALPPTLYKLAVNTLGHGQVILDPPGGTYKAGTVVTVSATPDSGFTFMGWGGDLLGTTSPATITMNSNKNVKVTFKGSFTKGQIVNEEVQIGTSSNASTVTTSLPLTAVAGDFYLAAITSKPRLNVLSVTGLGLNWTPVTSQCSGRNIAGVEIWMAQGTLPQGGTDEAVTASMTSPASNMVIIVSRYSGVSKTMPIGAIIAANTTGSAGACAGGVDTPNYAVNLNTTVSDALVYGAVIMRSKTHTAGLGFTEQVELAQGAGGNMVSLAVFDKHFTSPAAVVVDGKFNGAVDWAVVALELKPGLSRLRIKTVGNGTVGVVPADSIFAPGTLVTLRATPGAGAIFSGWSGDITSTANPLAFNIIGEKNLIATFIPKPDPNLNIAKLQSMKASGSDSTAPVANVVDGNKDTFWRSVPLTAANPNAWIRVDLGSAQKIGRVIIKWKSGDYAKSYDLQISDDDSIWTTFYTNTSGKKGTAEIKFIQKTARYVRLNMLKFATSSYRITEFEVYYGDKLTKGATEVSETEEIPTEIFLAQNYPNPFNPSTAIEYGLPQSSRVTLKVFNVAGQLVATLFDGYQEAGRHEITFNAARLSSGTYFTVLQAGSFRQVRRIVLMK